MDYRAAARQAGNPEYVQIDDEERQIWSLGTALPVLLAWLPIGYVYYAAVFLVALPNFKDDPTKFQAELIAFNVLFLLFVWAYGQAMFTEPGVVPDDYVPEDKLIEHNRYVLRHDAASQHNPFNYVSHTHPMPGGSNVRMALSPRSAYSGNSTGATVTIDDRFCGHCERWRPNRAYHCGRCHRCTLRWDHHSLFLNQCIGHFNIKFYMQLLGYLMLVFAAATFIIADQLGSNRQSWNGRHYTIGVHLIVAGSISLLSALYFLQSLSRYLYYAGKGRTTYEHVIFQDLGPYSDPYAVGWHENLSAICGKFYFITWCLPVSLGMEHDGVHHRTVALQDVQDAAYMPPPPPQQMAQPLYSGDVEGASSIYSTGTNRSVGQYVQEAPYPQHLQQQSDADYYAAQAGVPTPSARERRSKKEKKKPQRQRRGANRAKMLESSTPLLQQYQNQQSGNVTDGDLRSGASMATYAYGTGNDTGPGSAAASPRAEFYAHDRGGSGSDGGGTGNSGDGGYDRAIDKPGLPPPPAAHGMTVTGGFSIASMANVPTAAYGSEHVMAPKRNNSRKSRRGAGPDAAV